MGAEGAARDAQDEPVTFVWRQAPAKSGCGRLEWGAGEWGSGNELGTQRKKGEQGVRKWEQGTHKDD